MKKNKTLISVVAAQLIFVFVSAYTGFLMTRLTSYEKKQNLFVSSLDLDSLLSLPLCEFRFNLLLFSRAFT